VLVAVSAPTALALRVAEGAGITVAGIARDDGFEVFTHPGRIAPDCDAPDCDAPDCDAPDCNAASASRQAV